MTTHQPHFTGNSYLSSARPHERYLVPSLSFPPFPVRAYLTRQRGSTAAFRRWHHLGATPYNMFRSNHIAMSLPMCSGHLNPLIIYQKQSGGVYCKSSEYLVLYCLLCLVLINLCGRRALWALVATVMRVCLVWGLCTTNADGLYGCRSSLALSHNRKGEGNKKKLYTRVT